MDFLFLLVEEGGAAVMEAAASLLRRSAYTFDFGDEGTEVVMVVEVTGADELE